MTHNLDRTLRELLKRELSPSVAQQVAISFDPPDDRFPPQAVTLPAIDLFLYNVRENRDLRSNDYIVVRCWNKRQISRANYP